MDGNDPDLGFLVLLAPMKCFYCQEEFVQARASHKVCLGAGCRKKRDADCQRAWRAKNPDYNKGLCPKRKAYQKKWRDKNKDKIRAYREKRKVELRGYMREYMRAYRKNST